MEKKCPFCCHKTPVLENSLAYAIYDLNPVNKGHLLVIPRRHYADFFDSTKEERDAIFSLIWEGKHMLDAQYAPDGYNVGVNCGIVSGQSILHVHVQLIPRYAGDMEDPLGGVRGVIPERQKYPTDNRP